MFQSFAHDCELNPPPLGQPYSNIICENEIGSKLAIEFVIQTLNILTLQTHFFLSIYPDLLDRLHSLIIFIQHNNFFNYFLITK